MIFRRPERSQGSALLGYHVPPFLTSPLLANKYLISRSTRMKEDLMPQTAVQKFIAATRDLFAAENDPKRRWEKMPSLLQELLADPAIKEHSRNWPTCSQSDRAQNLLFYEDPDYKFVIN